MNLTEKLISKPIFRVGAAVVLTGLLSLGVYTCTSLASNFEKQAENYIESLYLNNIPYPDK